MIFSFRILKMVYDEKEDEKASRKALLEKRTILLKLSDENLKKHLEKYPGDFVALPFKMRDDKELVKIAVRKHGDLMRYASERLCQDKDIIEIAAKSGWFFIPALPLEIRECRPLYMQKIKEWIIESERKRRNM